LASGYGHKEAVNLLLSLGADSNIRDNVRLERKERRRGGKV
jgi:ankyrin repeat protein